MNFILYIFKLEEINESVIDDSKNNKNSKSLPKSSLNNTKQGTLEKFNFKLPEQDKLKISNADTNNVMKDLPKGLNLKIFCWNVNGLRAFKGKGTLQNLIKNGILKIFYLNLFRISWYYLF